MNEKQILEAIMSELKINKTSLGEMAGYSSKSAVTEILNRKGMKIEIFLKLLKVMGCELVVRRGEKEWIFGE